MHTFPRALLALLLAATSASSATVYVATDGNDSTPCAAAQHPQSPRRSLTAGIACLASGDTLLVDAGTYTECVNDYGSVRPPSGTSWDTATTLKAAQPGSVLLKQPRPECPGGAGTIEFGQAQYLIIDGFVLDGQFDASSTANVGVGSGEGARYIRYQNLEVRHFRTSVSSMGSFLEFRNLHVHHTGHPVCTSEVGCSAYYVRGEHNVIEGGSIHDNNCNGIQFSSGGGTPVRHNTVQNAEIHHNGCAGVVAYPTQVMKSNHIHHNNGGINTYGNVEVRGNCLVDNRGIGLLLQAGSGFAVHGNVFVGNPGGAIDTATFGASLTDYSDNRCDQAGPGCTGSADHAAAGHCPRGPSSPSPPPARPVRPAPTQLQVITVP